MRRLLVPLLLVTATCAPDRSRPSEAARAAPSTAVGSTRPTSSPVRRDLDAEACFVASERHLAVRRGTLVAIRMRQPGFDVGLEIALARPGGSPPQVVDFVPGGHGEETFSWIPAEDGLVTVTILAPIDRIAVAEHLTFDVEEQEHPDAAGRLRAEAFALMLEANAASAASDAPSLRRAVTLAQRAAAGFTRPDDGALRAGATQLEVNALYMLDAYRPCISAADRGIASAGVVGANDFELHRMRGQCLFALGDVGGAESDWSFVRDHAEADMSRYSGGAATHELGRLYALSGRYREALGSFHDSLRVADLLGLKKMQAFDQWALGGLHRTLGHAEPALAHLAAAGDLFAATRRVRARAGVLYDVGVTRRDLLGDAAGAMRDFETATQLLENTGSIELTSALQNAIGALLHARGDSDAALASIERARAIAVGAGLTLSEAEALASLGHVQRTLGKAAQAVRTLTSATSLFRVMGAVGSRADAQAELALALRDVGRHGDAERAARDAVATVESVQSILAPELRSAQFATVERVYDVLVDVLLSRTAPPSPTDVVEALRESDAARARMLLARITRREGPLPFDPPPELVAARDEALRDLGAQHERRAALARHDAPPGRQAAAAIGVREATVRYQRALDRLLGATPATTLLLRPSPLDVQALAARVGRGGVLLHFALAAERSHLWIVTTGGVRVVPLPREADVAGAVAALRDAIDEERRYVPGEGAAANGRRARAEAARVEAAGRLSRWLLGDVDELRNAERVFVVADGCLSDVPFALVPDPHSGAPLVMEHELTMLPSSGLLLALVPADTRRAPKKIVVLADPVFAADDPRVRATAAAAEGASPTAPPAPAGTPLDVDAVQDDERRGARWRTLARLRFSREEAFAIAGLAPAAELRVDFAASKQWVTSSDLREYGILHIATHGLVDARQPELSGLVLSSVARDGSALDGFLQLDDVYRLRLDADLVVLSACDSALGQTLSGEGVVGLTRAFLHAGARRVLSTSWAVNDRATSELLARFYRAHLRDGHTPARALAIAQRESAKVFASPADWAGFALYGLE